MKTQLLLLIAVLVSAVGSALALSKGADELLALAFVIPALFVFARQHVATWLLVSGLGLFGAVANDQPVAVSVCSWMLFPVLQLVFSPRRHIHVSILVIAVSIAMNTGLIALQLEGKLGGFASYTLIQLFAVGLVWLAVLGWKNNRQFALWPAILVAALVAAGWGNAALLSLTLACMIYVLQQLTVHGRPWLSHLPIILPSLAFATLIMLPSVATPMPVFISWVMIFAVAWLGEFLLADEEPH